MQKIKNVVLGVTGGIAAFKAASLIGVLNKNGMAVKVIMTKNATEFITPLTLSSLSKNKVAIDMFDKLTQYDTEHITLAKWADAFVIAPATANIIGKIANGIADNMLSTTVMATTAPVLIAPAMNTDMYQNIIVQSNIQKLKDYGYHFVEPQVGMLACGDEGIGKLANTEDIFKALLELTKEEK